MASTIDHLYTASKSCPDGIDRLFLLEKKEYVVVDDSHIQRVVVATAETTVTQQVSYRPNEMSIPLVATKRYEGQRVTSL